MEMDFIKHEQASRHKLFLILFSLDQVSLGIPG